MHIKNNCRKATMIIEKREVDSISLLKRLELAVHLSGCKECTIYAVQSRQLNEVLRDIFLQSTISEPGLGRAAKKQLQQLINDELKNK
ncbi:MAG: hypothetical protein ABIU63_16095 [Chitinophagaceae bacterium]